MKKLLAIILSLLMCLGMAACSKSQDKAQAPAPTEVPAQLLVAEALDKLAQVKSLHMDMSMLMDISVSISAEGMNMSMPIKMTIDYLMDVQKEPNLSKADLKMEMNMAAFGNQTNSVLVYMDMTGDAPVGYTSEDDGKTWSVGSTDIQAMQPQASMDLVKEHAKAFEKKGPDTFNGKAVTVYTGKLDGQYAQQVLSSTGMEEMLTDLTSSDDPTASEVALGDMSVTIYVDDETGYPVFYSMDMTDTLKDVILKAMQGAMGGAEDMDVQIDVSAIKADTTLSNFDAVEPIVIPEAALAAANN